MIEAISKRHRPNPPSVRFSRLQSGAIHHCHLFEDAKSLLPTAGHTDAKTIGYPKNSRVILSKFADRCHHSGSEISAGETSEDEEDDSMSDKSAFINDAEVAPTRDKQRVRKFLNRYTGKRTPKGRSKAAKAPPPVPPRRRVIHDSD